LFYDVGAFSAAMFAHGAVVDAAIAMRTAAN
jgi:hypothetical protein